MNGFCQARAIGYSIGGKQLLADVSLRLQGGEIVALLGPNGAGKSTLLRTMAGEYASSSGSVTYAGRTIDCWSAAELACMRAVMSQAQELAFPFRVEEVVGMGCDGIGRARSSRQRLDVTEYCSALADVLHLWGRHYQDLSGGEKQRVQFARTLAQLHAGQSVASRQTLFLDEPVSSLDIEHQWRLMEAVRKLAADHLSVLVILHDINLACAYADRIVVLHQGRLAADGAPSDVVIDEMIATVFGVRRRPQPDVRPGTFILPQTHMPMAGHAPEEAGGRVA